MRRSGYLGFLPFPGSAGSSKAFLSVCSENILRGGIDRRDVQVFVGSDFNRLKCAASALRFFRDTALLEALHS